MTSEASPGAPVPLPFVVAVLADLPPVGELLFRVIDRKIDRPILPGQTHAEPIECLQFPPGSFQIRDADGSQGAVRGSCISLFMAPERPPNNQGLEDILREQKGASVTLNLDTPVSLLIKGGSFSSLVHQILHSLFEEEKIR